MLGGIHGAFAQTRAVTPRPTANGDTQAQSKLELVASFPDRQVTGVTVSPGKRVFVCFPYWSDQYQGAVAEILPAGQVKAYPDDRWNAWRLNSDLDPRSYFICAQSVVADDQSRLWVLDPAAPKFLGPLAAGPKLVQIDLSTDAVTRVYHFPPGITPPGSYLNDVRIDTNRNTAYITDSGLGAIIVVNLSDGSARRCLANHHSTKAHNITPVIGGRPWRTETGKVPQIHSDGIALSPAGDYLYYHALTGYHLYRVPTQALHTLADQSELLAATVEDLGPDVVCDGMLMNSAGQLYLTALEQNAIVKRTRKGELRTIVHSDLLRWPDTLTMSPDGYLYITVSQIHLTRRFNPTGRPPLGDWAVYRVKLPQ